MQAPETLAVDVGTVVKERVSMTIRINVVGLRIFRIRLWLGARILALGGWVAGIPTVVSIDD